VFTLLILNSLRFALSRINKTFLSLLLAQVLTGSWALAAEISQIKGNKALLNIQAEEIQEGTDFYAVDSNGKKKAILHVTKVRGTKAIADILKGTAEPGQSLRPRPQQASSAAPGNAPTARSEPTPTKSSDNDPDRNARPRGFWGTLLHRGTAVGIMGGIAQDTMSLTGAATVNNVPYTDSLSLKGNSYNLMGFYDMDMTPSWTIDLKGGVETFTANGSTSQTPVCSNSTGCSVSFTYLSGEANLRYNYLKAKTKAWVGLGGAFMLAVAKSSSVSNLNTNSATNQMILFGTGADFSLGHGSFIPVSFEYGMFPGSSTVTASTMVLRAGYGWRF